MKMIDWMTDEEKSEVNSGDSMSEEDFIKLYIKCKNRKKRHDDIMMFKISMIASFVLVAAYFVAYMILIK